MSAITKVKSLEEIQITAQLAHQIWNQHYVPIIGQEQVDYMLEKFQRFEAIKTQIDSGYEYYLLSTDELAIGYLGLVPNNPPGKLMISKIYINSNTRGTGYGRQLIDFTKELCKTRGFKSLWLTVNRDNSNTITWYKKRGFVITREAKQDIGNGYYMDDYFLELAIDPSDH